MRLAQSVVEVMRQHMTLEMESIKLWALPLPYVARPGVTSPSVVGSRSSVPKKLGGAVGPDALQATIAALRHFFSAGSSLAWMVAMGPGRWPSASQIDRR